MFFLIFNLLSYAPYKMKFRIVGAVWCYCQVVRQGSAKALFPSSNLGSTSKFPKVHRGGVENCHSP